MKAEERIAELYLQQLNLGPVVFEPHGQVTPDFVVDGRIGVEVRRLNQYHYGDGSRGPVALENLAHTVQNIFRRVIKSFGPPLPDDGNGPRNWGIFYRYERTGVKPKGLEQEIREALTTIRDTRASTRQDIHLLDGISMKVIVYPTVKQDMFFVFGDGDQDSGGMLMSIYQESLDLAVAEKWAKVAKSTHHAAYPIWWLVLIDTVGFAMDGFDRDMFLEQVSVARGFDRVILVPSDGSHRSIDVPIRQSPTVTAQPNPLSS